MATEFIPDPGTYFYMQVRPWDRVIEGGFMSETTVVKMQDRSFRDQIFYCVARDATHLVSHRVYNGFSTETDRRLDMIANRIFAPVGPDVLAALVGDLRTPPENTKTE